MDARPICNGSNISACSHLHLCQETSSKKKPKKWSLGGLFKRRRTKSSDTDSSSELDEKKKTFLPIRPSRRAKGGSRKVVGKFEAIIMPKEGESPLTSQPAADRLAYSIQNYDASPNVIKRRHNEACTCVAAEATTARNGGVGYPQLSTTYQNPIDCVQSSNGSLDMSSHRADKYKVKSRMQARREHLADSSSSDEIGSSSRTSNCSSTQRVNSGSRDSISQNRKSRAARTDRYIRRHFNDGLPKCCSSSDSRLVNYQQRTGNSRNQSLTKIVYQQSNDYPTTYTAMTQSATSSPLGSPLGRPKRFQCYSLPAKRTVALYEPHGIAYPDCEYVPVPKSWESLPKGAPLPPPRNPNRRVIPLGGRPSSYAFDASCSQCDIRSYMNDNKLSYPMKQSTSNSEMNLMSHEKLYPLKATYCADNSPRSRNPIQLISGQEEYKPVISIRSPGLGAAIPGLRQVNQIGIPISKTAAPRPFSTVQPRIFTAAARHRDRPLSVVSEKSDNEILQPDKGPKSKAKNLEEALVELEEIYNSLRLGDEDLLDRAERRDFQSALRMNPNFSRFSWNDLDDIGTDVTNDKHITSSECLYSPDDRQLNPRPILRSRRSAVPDAVADDMARRKLNKKDSNPISNPNLVSRSGSFLLMSPALSPPPIVDIPPVLGQLNQEPDITLDDVVYRSIRQTNNKLKALDPQPMFGIPVGPVAPASNSDYLHAVPGQKYKSTFHPMRTPDIVKDDVAFRNLRKDMQSRTEAMTHFAVPYFVDTEARKRSRATRSLSANIVSMEGRETDSEDEESYVDVNCNNLRKGDRSISFNNLPDVLDDYESKNQILVKNCYECLDPKLFGKGRFREIAAKETEDLRRRLKAFPTKTEGQDVFRKNIVLHKPITLDRFTIKVEEGRNVNRNSSQKNENSWDLEDCSKHQTGRLQNVKCDGVDELDVMQIENSSSGVSSTSDTPDSGRKSGSAVNYAVNYDKTVASARVDEPTRFVTELFLDEGVVPSVMQHLNGQMDMEVMAGNELRGTLKDDDGVQRKCSRLEITLSTPQPSGVVDDQKRWSVIETKDAAIMTDLRVRGGNENCNRPRMMNGDSSQARISRCKEERRKQLAGQLANLLRNRETARTSSSLSTESSSRKTTLRAHNTNGVKEDDIAVRKSKTSNDRFQSGVKGKEGLVDSETEKKSNNDWMTTADSTASNLSRSNRDKNGKRKSSLNRSANVEKTQSYCRSLNYHHHHHYTSDEKCSVNCNGNSTRSNVPSSLPVPVSGICTSPCTASSVSSQKLSPSRSYRKTLLCKSQPNLELASSDVHTNFVSAIAITPQATSTKQLSVSKLSNSRHKPSIPSKISGNVHSKSTLTTLKNGTDMVCDNQSSNFRFRQADSVYFRRESTSASTDLSKSDSKSSDRPLKFRTNGGCPKSDHVFYPKNTPTVGTIHNEKLFSQKNSLLEIIQNFPEGNSKGDERTDSTPPNSYFSTDSEPKQSTITETTDKQMSAKNEPMISASPCSPPLSQSVSLEIIEEDNSPTKPSILKNKFNERSNSLETPRYYSILKRKSRDEANAIGSHTNMLAVGKQGILKKYNSLDEEEVARRSCSPDVYFSRQQEFKPILKSQRRFSFEEIVRHSSPPELHSILKPTKQLSDESSDNGINPHSILKRKVSTMNGSTLDTETFSDTESSTMRPILKNKQHSLEMTMVEKHFVETPKPILKNKYFIELEYEEDKPMKPILKSSRKSIYEPNIEASTHEFVEWGLARIKPILKRKEEYKLDPRTVKSDDDMTNSCKKTVDLVKRHSLPDSEVLTGRSLSPPEQIYYPFCVDKLASSQNFTNEVNEVNYNENESKSDPRISCFCGNNKHYETQPIAVDELAVTRNSLFENYSIKKTLMTSKMNSAIADDINTDSDSSNKVKSQSKPDDSDNRIENIDEKSTDEKDTISKLKRSNSVSARASLFAQLAKECEKARGENILKKKSDKDAGRKKVKVRCSDMSSRFSTQPVTLEEVAEAAKQNVESRNKGADVHSEILKSEKTYDLNEIDGTSSYKPISERLKMFTIKEENYNKTKLMRRPGSRFKTLPVTGEELQIVKDGLVEASNKNNVTGIVESSKLRVLPLNTKKEQILPDRMSSRKSAVENSSGTSSQSEGDTSSSGGREIQEIIRKQEKNHTNRNRTSKMIAAGTDVVDECSKINGNSSIAQRLAALQKSGQLDWKKRISRLPPEKEVSPIIKINETQELLKKELNNGFKNKINADVRLNEKNDGTLANRLEKLETSSQTWKKRVEPSDATQFSVVGKMASSLPSTPKILPSSPSSERKKRGPCPSRFRSFREQKRENQSDPTTPEKCKSATVLNRSTSVPSDTNDEGSEETPKVKPKAKENTVSVPHIFDDDFSTFFGKVESVPISGAELDFSCIKSEIPRLSPTHKTSRPKRNHQTSGNPLKNMANKIEIKNEYREVKTKVADRDVKKMNVEKFSMHSSLAVEALAGLASKENFASVQLKKAAPISSPMLPYKPLMLLHIKGRRHVQTRLVEPIIESVNSGDCYILITENEVYHWIGEFSNVIERSRGVEISQHVVTTHDLGCSGATSVITINEDSPKNSKKHVQQFWTLLGATVEQASKVKAVPAGHPDEDEIYESSLLSTNMVYEAEEDELVPVDKFWASIPKIQMLDPNKILVFDFGTELYIWMGKNVDMKRRKSSSKLAKELWENGFNYTECDLCPIFSAMSIGSREKVETKTHYIRRPDWCLFAKVTQNMETVLFREKFLDWPDFSRVIRKKEKDIDEAKNSDYNFDLSPCNVKDMLEVKLTEPDLELEGCHLGRGSRYFDEERKLYYSIATSEVRMWHVAEFESEEVKRASMGQFYSTDSYVIKWVYSISYTGRELSGQPSKYTTMGRDRLVYFCWQGKNASLNEQGAAALLTVELDEEKGIQKRISQGNEPPAFFNLFKGRAIIYKSKSEEKDKDWRLFICRGELENEVVLLEVSCNIKQLRSRASFVLVNVSTGAIFIWHGCKVLKPASKACQVAVSKLIEDPPPELGIKTGVLNVKEVNEGNEPKDFFDGLGSNSRKLYVSLLNEKGDYDTTPMLFHLKSTDGTLKASPILAPCRHKTIVTAYPFLQEYLYSANQPALFMMHSGDEIWLWQGWWPEREAVLEGDPNTPGPEDGGFNLDKDRGSASIRWQVQRRAAMQTAIDYWKVKYKDKPIKAYLVWAGLEPVHFTNLFPDWKDRDDVAEMNIMDGRKPGEVLGIEQELERLTQSTYPLEQLLQRPLPEGVDPTKLELYLSDTHFKEILKMTKEEFTLLPLWKQTNLKKNVGLF